MEKWVNLDGGNTYAIAVGRHYVVAACAVFYQYQHLGWFTMMTGFIALPYVVAMGGIIYYVRAEYKKDTCRKAALMLLSPNLPIFCDVLMPFYRIMGIVAYGSDHGRARVSSRGKPKERPGIRRFLSKFSKSS